jgi:LPXTG-site transpeptidase (sortase) family protein
MERRRHVLRSLQRTCIVCGGLLSGFCALSLLAGEAGRRADVDAFAGSADPDQTLWSETRVRDFASSRGLDAGRPVAVLRIQSLNLEVPVYSDTSELHLNRGVGLVEGAGSPDKGGNAAIAGHRDGFFRVLMNLKQGDIIEVETHLRAHRYRVTAVDIVDKNDNRLLLDTDEPTITLVTCYPFYFVGPAPKRFLVRGDYVW